MHKKSEKIGRTFTVMDWTRSRHIELQWGNCNPDFWHEKKARRGNSTDPRLTAIIKGKRPTEAVHVHVERTERTGRHKNPQQETSDASQFQIGLQKARTSRDCAVLLSVCPEIRTESIWRRLWLDEARVTMCATLQSRHKHQVRFTHTQLYSIHVYMNTSDAGPEEWVTEVWSDPHAMHSCHLMPILYWACCVWSSFCVWCDYF